MRLEQDPSHERLLYDHFANNMLLDLLDFIAQSAICNANQMTTISFEMNT